LDPGVPPYAKRGESRKPPPVDELKKSTREKGRNFPAETGLRKKRKNKTVTPPIGRSMKIGKEESRRISQRLRGTIATRPLNQNEGSWEIQKGGPSSYLIHRLGSNFRAGPNGCERENYGEDSEFREGVPKKAPVKRGREKKIKSGDSRGKNQKKKKTKRSISKKRRGNPFKRCLHINGVVTGKLGRRKRKSNRGDFPMVMLGGALATTR